MKTAVGTVAWPLANSRVADYLELTKPRLTALVLFTVAAGAWLGTNGPLELASLLHTVAGVALVAGGASALNQLWERHTDALMRRTENRPLPTGRLQPWEGLLFGLSLSLGGLLYLALCVRQPLTVGLAALSLVIYVLLYTPLKRRTTLNTLVGAIPGALPPVIGWSATCGRLEAGATALFLILFIWQIPHFLSIAWLYREDYERAGLCMLPRRDPAGYWLGGQMVLYCLALVPVSLLPVGLGQAGLLYLVLALVLGSWFLLTAIQFVRAPGNLPARRVLRASLGYLPLLLTGLVLARL
jgi:protoheme IX farnesyltransferase